MIWRASLWFFANEADRSVNRTHEGAGAGEQRLIVWRKAGIAALLAGMLAAPTLASADVCDAGRSSPERIRAFVARSYRFDADCAGGIERNSLTGRLGAAFAPVRPGARGFSIVNLALARVPGIVPDLTSGSVAPIYRTNLIGGWTGTALDKISSTIRPFNLPSIIGAALQFAF
jgi:hypothetical protein